MGYTEDFFFAIQAHVHARELVDMIMEYTNAIPIQRVKNLLIRKHIISNKRNPHEYLMLQWDGRRTITIWQAIGKNNHKNNIYKQEVRIEKFVRMLQYKFWLSPPAHPELNKLWEHFWQKWLFRP